MSFPKLKLSTLCTVLTLPLSSKIDIIVSAADTILAIVDDTTSGMLSFIDSDNNEIDN